MRLGEMAFPVTKGTTPHPVPLPLGEGTKAATVVQASPLPWGEGQGRFPKYFSRQVA